MSAITGIFYRNGRKVKPRIIKKMNDKLSHRGPNGSSVWSDGPVGLGHQMLWTTPESLHEKLPFYDNTAGLVITADSRIDNRKDLSEDLEINDNEEISDSYFILKAYEKWGENCPKHLLGDFAFAIWDENHEKLFCARDHFGVKPFNYYLSDNLFCFSTEIKAIHCIPEVLCKLNQLMAAFYLIPNVEIDNLTFYEEILRLPAAHSLTIDLSNVQIQKFWNLDHDLKVRMDSDEDYINKFRELFNEAVRCRLRSAFPIGFELSGGLDSSSIVDVAKNLTENKGFLNTFSLVTEDPQSDESFFIKKMIESGGINPYLLNVDKISPLNDANEISWHLEHPLFSPNVSFFWNLYKKMKRNNIRVLFRGYDGDGVISQGQFYMKELLLNGQWKSLLAEIHGISKRQNLSPYNVLLNKAVFPIVPSHLRNLWRQIRGIRKEGDFIFNNKELDSQLNFKEKYKLYDKFSINPKNAKEFHYILITQGSHQFAFEFLDKLISAFSIEPRYPYFDKRLVEFCYAIPTEQKFKFGWDRMILRRSMSDSVPEEIRWRPLKKFLTPVFEENFLKFEKECINYFIYEKSDNYKFFANPEDIMNIYRRYKLKNDDYQISDVRDIWKVVTLMLWLQGSK
jgi:asparagine synthase (glutamine-hydrolysing)